MALRVGLTHTQMKLGRADKHINELDSEVSKFFGNEPYTVTRKDHTEHPLHIFRVELGKMHDDIGMLIGEFAYQLRSALDNLTWQLALLTTTTPHRDTSFPITETKPTPKSDRFIAALWDIPCAASDIIKSFQPYTAGKDFKSHPLWQLNKLCNIDKHRGVAVGYTQIAIRVDDVAFARRKDIPSEHAIEIAIPIADKENAKFNISDPTIIFGDPIDDIDGISELEMTIADLRSIYKFVRYEVAPRFETFFIDP